MWYATVILLVNVVLALLVFGEMGYLLVRALCSKNFTFDSEFCQKHFWNKKTISLTLGNSIYLLKGQILMETETIEPLIAESDGKFKLDDNFVDLVIYTGRAEHKFNTLSVRHEIFDVYLKPQHGSVAINTVKELFLPNKDTQNPSKILVIGRPGIGKSLLCTKISCDWGKDDLLPYFHLFYLIRFRWFNDETLQKISLKELLCRLHPEGSNDDELLQYVLDNPEKVIIVFDGLDEFENHSRCLEDDETYGGNNAKEEMPLSALYVKLMKGKLLPGATILTTSRPNAVQSIAHLTQLCFNRKVEIMGFTTEKIRKYVEKHFDEERVDGIWSHISSNLELLSLCYIPVNTRIICSLLEECLKLQEQNPTHMAFPSTLTKVYKGALKLFIFKHHSEFKGKPLTEDFLMGNVDFPDPVEKTLIKAGALAKEGIEQGRLVFDSREVQGIEKCGLFNRMPNRKVSSSKFKSQYCFLHLTFQEFLAAREIAKMDPGELKSFVRRNASDPKWHLVLQFVAGLLGDKRSKAVIVFVNMLCGTMEKSEPTRMSGWMALLMMKCLYEYNDEATVKQAATEILSSITSDITIGLQSCSVTAPDCVAIVYLIKHLQVNIVLHLAHNLITDEGVSHLCASLKDEHCKLTKLDLLDNNISDKGVSHLCAALKDEHCKLTKLDLLGNNLSDQGVSHLCAALKDEHCKLTKLDLSGNNISDEGVSHLCAALKDEHCKLTKLDLLDNNISDQGVSDLCAALKDERCKLTKLELFDNSISDKGASHLCAALKDEHCKLTKLDLSNNSISDQGVSHLCAALKDEHCKLTKLELSGNKISDQGVSHLCAALKDEHCKLTKLDLRRNNISDEGASHLCAALKDEHCKLTKLHLSGNNKSDEGVPHLCAALKDEHCKLTKLDLSYNNISEEGASHLCAALKDEHCKLTKLDLSCNNISEEGASHLCAALKDEHCKLTKLNLSDNNISDKGVSHLCAALKDEHCKLTKLDLSNNSISDQGVSHLCAALKDEHCKLTKLDLSFNNISDQGVSHLCAALKDEHCKLTKLDLGQNNISEQGKSHLCAALKDEHCKLIKLG
ncbi:unnamed protein product [Pocillopora meandrina]|uniref:NACHT domain-containing protein n=1 Tax=Pocillopora meandrina TaxID=46732 RepID=A0AAU9W4K7_9CNID|nr:unnamed protein product [Pocillopora meandrina]